MINKEKIEDRTIVRGSPDHIVSGRSIYTSNAFKEVNQQTWNSCSMHWGCVKHEAGQISSLEPLKLDGRGREGGGEEEF